jgi:sn-glycerol 3-phosphate transport system permease protein
MTGGFERSIHGWLLLLPAMALLALFTHWPALGTFVDSLWSTARPRRPSTFIGLEQYRSMLADLVLWKSIVNNLWFALGTIPASIALALLMAVWVNDHIAGRATVRMAYFTPTVMPMIAVANIWLFFYTPQYGLFEQVLSRFGAQPHNWLGTPDTALACIIAVAIWKEAGFFMIFYLAALQQMSPTLAEAAALEGASRWTFFRRVQFPLLMPTTLFVLINAVVNAFRSVDQIIVMTRGGPDNATSLLLYYICEVGFIYWDTGYGCVNDAAAGAAGGGIVGPVFPA